MCWSYDQQRNSVARAIQNLWAKEHSNPSRAWIAQKTTNSWTNRAWGPNQGDAGWPQCINQGKRKVN